MEQEHKEPPTWERTLRFKLAFLCMAAVAGREGDLRNLTEDLVHFCQNLAGQYDRAA